jgi:hypothetical protein
MTAPLNLFGLGQRSVSPNVTGGHRLNMYYQINQDADKCQVNAIGTPGLLPFTTVSGSKSRGVHWLESNNALYVVQYNVLYEITQSGTITNRGNLRNNDISTGVSMANNGKQLLIVTGVAAYLYVIATQAFTDITITLPDYGVAGTSVAGTCCFLDSYFIINQVGSGQFWVSNSYDGSIWGSLNFATAESNPDNLQAVVADKGKLVLIGTSSTEVWVNTGALAFPYQRVQGAISQSGIAAVFSLTNINNSVVGLVRNKQGMLAVAALNGYIWEPLSSPDMDYIFTNYTSPSDAVAFGYAMNGRAFYQINFVTAGKTWLFDFQSNAWSQLKSSGISNHLALYGCAFGDKFIVTDYANGNLYQLSDSTYTDNGAYIERELTSKHLYTPSLNYLSIRRIRVDFEGGVGLILGQGLLPTVMIQISRDNGHTWGNEMWTDIGTQGDYQQRAEWRRLGQSRDWLFKLRITDPVKVVLIRAVVEATVLNK